MTDFLLALGLLGAMLLLAGADYAAISAVAQEHHTIGGLLAAIGGCMIGDVAAFCAAVWFIDPGPPFP